MSLAITAGSLPTLRPLYRVAAKKLSLKSSFFSARQSSRTSPTTLTIGGTGLSRKIAGYASCSESECNIVPMESQDFVLQDQSSRKGLQGMGITRATHVEVNYEDMYKV